MKVLWLEGENFDVSPKWQQVENDNVSKSLRDDLGVPEYLHVYHTAA